MTNDIPTTETALRKGLMSAVVELAEYAERHPGRSYLEGLLLRLVCLKTFLDGARDVFAEKDHLRKIAEFVDAASFGGEFAIEQFIPYDPLENFDLPPLIKKRISNIYWARIEEDLRLDTDGGIDIPALRKLEEQIHDLENTRNEILTICRLLGSQELGDEKNGDLIFRLTMYWKKFQHSWDELKCSSLPTNITFAIAEIRESLADNKMRSTLSNLPSRVQRKSFDYHHGRGFQKRFRKSGDGVKFEEVHLEEIEKIGAADHRQIEESIDVRLAVEKLSPAQLRVVEKIKRGEQLKNSADRKMKQRLESNPHLKQLDQ